MAQDTDEDEGENCGSSEVEERKERFSGCGRTEGCSLEMMRGKVNVHVAVKSGENGYEGEETEKIDEGNENAGEERTRLGRLSSQVTT